VGRLCRLAGGGVWPPLFFRCPFRRDPPAGRSGDRLRLLFPTFASVARDHPWFTRSIVPSRCRATLPCFFSPDRFFYPYRVVSPLQRCSLADPPLGGGAGGFPFPYGSPHPPFTGFLPFRGFLSRSPPCWVAPSVFVFFELVSASFLVLVSGYSFTR